MRYDAPLKETSGDLLARCESAKQFVEEVHRSFTAPASLAIGLVGPWGWGKTSFLRLMELAVEGVAPIADVPQPVVVWFNPWWFSGRDDLYSQFFLEISEQAKKKVEGTQEKQRWGRALGAMATVLSAGVAKPLVDTLAEEHDLQLEQAKSLTILRSVAHEDLIKAKRQLWVFIDDLDRVAPSSIAHFFALVRSMADLPWIRYFIPYDKESLRDLVAAGPFRGQSSTPEDDRVNDYMEKFIQVEVDLAELLDREQSPSRVAGPAEEPKSASGPSSETAVSEQPHNVAVVGRFAAEGYQREGFLRPVERIAWIRAYVEAVTASGDAIGTPREFLRWYVARCMLDSFHAPTLEADIDTISDTVINGGILDELIGVTGEDVARAFYKALTEIGTRGIVARRCALRFLGAWAQRAKLRPGEPAVPSVLTEPEKYEKIPLGQKKAVVQKISKGESQP